MLLLLMWPCDKALLLNVWPKEIHDSLKFAEAMFLCQLCILIHDGIFVFALEELVLFLFLIWFFWTPRERSVNFKTPSTPLFVPCFWVFRCFVVLCWAAGQSTVSLDYFSMLSWVSQSVNTGLSCLVIHLKSPILIRNKQNILPLLVIPHHPFYLQLRYRWEVPLNTSYFLHFLE